MENIKKEQTPPEVSAGSKLRFPLRSSLKPKQEATDVQELSVSRRVKSSPSVAQSTSALDLSGKEKSAKPPKRLSVPAKLNPTPRKVLTGNVTPISNVGTKSDTPLSDVSKSSSRRKFCVLSSVSYWMAQIKLAESASKHTISLGFFKLALVSGCEPFQRLREELKSYVVKHNLLTEHEEATKVVLKNFNIDVEKLKFVEDGPLSNKAEKSASTNAGNLKPKCLNSGALSVTNPNMTCTKKNSNMKKNNSNISEAQKKVQKSKTDHNKSGSAEGKKLAKDAVNDEADALCTEEKSHEEKENVEDKENAEDKENMDFQSMQEAVVNEEIHGN